MSDITAGALGDLPLFHGVDGATLEAVASELTAFALPGGATLFDQGDPPDALYVLLAGALGVYHRSEAGELRRVARIYPPETVGEMALLSGEPRTAGVVALRDATLLKFEREDFERLIERKPRAMLPIARILSNRLRDFTSQRAAVSTARTFALIPLTRRADCEELGNALCDALGGPRTVGVVTAEHEREDERWFHERELEHRFLIYRADDAHSDWTGICRRQADHLLFIARAGERLKGPVEAPRSDAREWRRRDLVVLYDGEPRAGLLADDVDDLDHDLRVNLAHGRPAELRRLARMMTGRAVGLTLAGGGARGFAHVGVIEALKEAGVPIDLIGGTSIGGIVAATYAMGWTDEEVRERILAAFVRDPPTNDYTFPLIALLKGRKVDIRLERHFGDTRIEDLALPFFCLSANLTRGEPRVHREGLLRQALRASIAIPGLLPPVIENREVLVDGAVLNNLPADVMAAHERGPVIAVDVAQDSALGAEMRADGREPLLRRLFGVPPGPPNIASLLFRSATVSSDAQSLASREKATLLIHPPLSGVDLRDWRQFDAAAKIGYEHTSRLISEGLLEPLGY